jgi:hypothetical protein
VYSFAPTASDPDGDTLSFTIVNRPSWATFNGVTGALNGTPAAGDVGSYGGIRITVSDGQAAASLPAFSIGVVAENSPPTISGSPATSVLEGANFSFVPLVNDPDGDALTFSIVNRPSWANFNTATGQLSGVPGATDVGVHQNILITVSDMQDTATLTAFSIEVIDVNLAPTISGNPPSSVLVDQLYSFVPTASDPDGNALLFSIANRPSWASFDTGTGALSGTPVAGDVGLYSAISITVTDGQLTDTLGPFSIDVIAVATGSATLSWTPPTENTDGSPLTDLDGFIVYWGTASGSYSNSDTIPNPGLTSYVVENLLSGTTYYFATKAFNSQDVQSNYSNEASKTIP